MFPMGVIDRDNLFLVIEFDTQNNSVKGKYLRYDENEGTYIPSDNIETISLDVFKYGFDYLTRFSDSKTYGTKEIIMNPYIEEIISSYKVIYH